MTDTGYILNGPLPLEQNFNALLEKGIEFIQEFSGAEWSNFNKSDPGITILEQICFALSELGYCGDFSVGDLLAGPDEKLKVENQFYRPEEMLTTSPVTCDDYVSLIVDQIALVKNALIVPCNTSGIRFYKIYLLLKGNSTIDNQIKDAACFQVFLTLNKYRNLGELFTMPDCFKEINVELSGTLVLESEDDFSKVILQLEYWWQNYTFPAAKPLRYSILANKGVSTEDIINGPKVENGWIPKKNSDKKRDIVRIRDVNNFFESITNIDSVTISGLRRKDQSEFLPEIPVDKEQIFYLDLVTSITDGNLKIRSKIGNPDVQKLLRFLKSHDIESSSTDFDQHILPEESDKEMLALPKIKYRDINDYYSIQNTFPEIYATGLNALDTYAAADYQVAQSRQLKAYLTIFDQVLANQFAQLANVEKLFSFSNAESGTPTDTEEFYARQNRFKISDKTYPVPYKSFSPTYFYQSLYDVPHIKPLLKGNNKFGFDNSPLSETEAQQKAWDLYKLDPYNPYIHGLMGFMEDESANLSRRNNLLDHLLARYGESPLLIDTIIQGSNYTGDQAKDKIIFKSLFLQNLGHLSYYRIKGVNYTAMELSGELPEITFDKEEFWTLGYDNDFIFNSTLIDKVEKIHEPDFNGYSAIELKLSLLFGLRPLYYAYINENKCDFEKKAELQIVAWLIQQRRGMIFLETGLMRYFMNDKNLSSDDESNNSLIAANGVLLILPDFIFSLKTEAFQNRLRIFLENSLPLALPYQYCFADTDKFPELISAYTDWVNSCNSHSNNSSKNAAIRLFDLLNIHNIKYYSINES